MGGFYKNLLSKSIPAFLALVALHASFSCRSLIAEEKIPVFVSILPQQYFVQQIGGNLVDVQVMVLPGASPAVYEPAPAQMTALARTRIYFSIGVPFESVWLEKIAAINPGMRVIPTDDGIDKQYLENHVCEEAASGPADQHDHDVIPLSRQIPDPHIWLSPLLVMIQAQTIMRGLQEIDPIHGEIYFRNCRRFMSRLTEMDEQLRKLFADVRNRSFMVFHPAWGYFCKTYGFKQIPLEIEGKSPKPAQLKKIIDYARQHDLQLVLVQPQASARYAEQVARAVAGQVVYADPLSSDWEKNLMEVAVKIKTALQ